MINWIIFSDNVSKRKFKLLTFFTLNVNLFVKKEGYNFLSLSDYVCARIINMIGINTDKRNWTSFIALYLAEVRKFTEYCTSSFSP